MKRLKLPPTIRSPRPDELPGGEELLNRIEEGRIAHIVEGYRFLYNDTGEHAFRFFAEINIDNNRLWELFKALAVQLPDEVSIVYNKRDEDPMYSGYGDKFLILNELEPLQRELTQDGFLEAGLLFSDENYLEEVFISAPKYLQYWGMDEDRFKRTMEEFNLYEVQGMKFIDEYPMVTEALSLHVKEVLETSEVLERLGGIVANDI